jgi:hypothetical protein
MKVNEYLPNLDAKSRFDLMQRNVSIGPEIGLFGLGMFWDTLYRNNATSYDEPTFLIVSKSKLAKLRLSKLFRTSTSDILTDSRESFFQ